MNVKVSDLMAAQVMTTSRHKSIGHVRKVMHEHGVHCIPVVDPDGTAAGIVTSTDLIGDGLSDTTPVSKIMSRALHTIPQYADVSQAARTMRNHGIHHVVVLHEKQVVGVLSSFDLLQLVEDHRFTMKNAPTPSRKSR